MLFGHVRQLSTETTAFHIAVSLHQHGEHRDNKWMKPPGRPHKTRVQQLEDDIGSAAYEL